MRKSSRNRMSCWGMRTLTHKVDADWVKDGDPAQPIWSKWVWSNSTEAYDVAHECALCLEDWRLLREDYDQVCLVKIGDEVHLGEWRDSGAPEDY